MIAKVGGKMCRVRPFEDVAGKLKYVDPNCDLVREAKLPASALATSSMERAAR